MDVYSRQHAPRRVLQRYPTPARRESRDDCLWDVWSRVARRAPATIASADDLAAGVRRVDDRLQPVAAGIAEDGDAGDDERGRRGKPERIAEPHMGYHRFGDSVAVGELGQRLGVEAEAVRDFQRTCAVGDAALGVNFAMEGVELLRRS